MRILARAAAVFAALAAAALPAAAKPPLEAFGDQPTIRAMVLSSDGSRIAYINTIGGKEMLVLTELATGKRTELIDASNIKPRSITFVGTDYLLLFGSKTLGGGSPFRDTVEFGGAFAVNIKTARARQLLPGAKTGLLQSGLSRVLAVDDDGKHIYTNAFAASRVAGDVISMSFVSFDLIKINLESGEQVGVGTPGSQGTQAWLSDTEGRPIARFDFGNISQVRQLYGYSKGRGARVIHSIDNVLADFSVGGVKEGGDSVMVVERPPQSQYMALFELSLADGAMSGPVMSRPDADVEGVITDRNSIVKGVVYAGFSPRYDFFDKTLASDVLAVQKLFSGESVRLASWSDDWSKLLFLTEGGKFPSQYFLVDRTAKSNPISILAQMRPLITDKDIGEVQAVRYNARDKLPIPALVTWPAGVAPADRKNLPLIVMPHGGPEAYDRLGFDWMAQYFANEGYMVLQPQFRGSRGFGLSFRNAGHKQWGRAMQSDVTDGLSAMVASGWVDPKRVCIVGWSYGGYAALAGATLTPELYKCVVSIAGVADLPEMLAHERRGGVKESGFIYWRSRIGDPATEMDQIKAVSPVQQAANVRAPVLLIHGQQDSVVPPEQSSMMERALKRLDKEVKLVRIPGDNRRAALQEMSVFVRQHLGPGAPRSPVPPATVAPAIPPAPAAGPSAP
jgi:dienelactone hydrolase